MDRNRTAVLLDASTKKFLLGIATLDFKTVHYEVYNPGDLKGENLLFEVERLLKENKLNKQDLSLVITSKGPGSLTGLRIIMSTVKTMAQVLGIPIAAIPTMYLLEKAFFFKHPEGVSSARIPILLQARRGVYYLRYSGDRPGGFEVIKKEALKKRLKGAAYIIKETHTDVTGLCDKNEHKFVSIGLEPELVMSLGIDQFEREETADYLSLLPDYGGKSVAALKHEQRLK